MASHHILNTALVVGLGVAGVAAQDAEPVGARAGVGALRDVSAEAKLLRGGDLVGAEILDAENESCAEVTDALLDRHGRLRALLLSVSDVEDSLVLVPADVVTPYVEPERDPAVSDELEELTIELAAVRDLDALVLTVDAELLRGAPRVADDSLDMPITPTRVAAAYEHFGYDVPDSLAVDADDEEADAMEQPVLLDGEPTNRARQPAEKAHFCRVSKVIGMPVTNTEDEDLGEVGDLAISLADDRVAYAVLDFGGTLGLGEKHFAVPYQALIPDASDEQLVLGVSSATLEEREGFDDWPHAADTELFPATPRPLTDDVALRTRSGRR